MQQLKLQAKLCHILITYVTTALLIGSYGGVGVIGTSGDTQKMPAKAVKTAESTEAWEESLDIITTTENGQHDSKTEFLEDDDNASNLNEDDSAEDNPKINGRLGLLGLLFPNLTSTSTTTTTTTTDSSVTPRSVVYYYVPYSNSYSYGYPYYYNYPYNYYPYNYYGYYYG